MKIGHNSTLNLRHFFLIHDAFFPWELLEVDMMATLSLSVRWLRKGEKDGAQLTQLPAIWHCESESRGLSTFDGARQLNLGDLQHSKIMTTHSACLRERRRAAALVNSVERAAGCFLRLSYKHTVRKMRYQPKNCWLHQLKQRVEVDDATQFRTPGLIPRLTPQAFMHLFRTSFNFRLKISFFFFRCLKKFLSCCWLSEQSKPSKTTNFWGFQCHFLIII